MRLISVSSVNRIWPICRSYWPTWLLVMVMIKTSSGTVIPQCALEKDDTKPTTQYCKCEKGSVLSGKSISIICDFRYKEDVRLTADLYPFEEKKLVQAYVRIENASRLEVSQEFLKNLQFTPSVVIDIWSAKTLSLDSSPRVIGQSFPLSYSTFMGIGIVNCTVAVIPKNLIRDRDVGMLNIIGSTIGVISQNTFFNVGKVKSLILEASSVERVLGPISNIMPVPLILYKSKSLGVKISNSSIMYLASSSFQFIGQDSHSDYSPSHLVLLNSRLGHVKTDAIGAFGKIHLTIQRNSFQHVHDFAFKVNVTGDLKFEENLIEYLEPSGLKSLFCYNNTSLDKNTIHMESMEGAHVSNSTIPFEASCGAPQVFIVRSPSKQAKTLVKTSNATWIILAVLIVFVIVIAYVVIQVWRSKAYDKNYRWGRAPIPMSFGDSTTMTELHNSVEDDVVNDLEADGDTGLSNPVYGIKEPN